MTRGDRQAAARVGACCLTDVPILDGSCHNALHVLVVLGIGSTEAVRY